MQPDTRYAKSGGAHIAYQVVGQGPPDIVLVPGFVSNVEAVWEEPHYSRFLEHLSSFARVILYDKRGTGMSDPVPVSELPTLEQRIDDLRAVLLAVGSERPTLFAWSEGGAFSLLYAATHPEWTGGLILVATTAKIIAEPGYPGLSAALFATILEAVDESWGEPLFLQAFAPSLADDDRFVRWWGRFLRLGASPAAAYGVLEMEAATDARPVLDAVRVPTLILHRTHEIGRAHV